VTSTLYEYLLHPLTDVGYQKALIGGSLTAIVCGVIGCFIILRRMAFLGDALSHAMLAGVVCGYLLMKVVFGSDAHLPAMLIGSVLAGLVTVGLIGFVSKVSRIKDDTAIGIMYTGIFAVGGILASAFSDRIHIHLYDFIVGMVLAVPDGQLWLMGVVSAGVLSVVILFYRQLQLTTFDPVMAASIGIPVLAVNYLLTTCTSLVVVAGVPVVGIVLVVGLLVTPAATAYLLCDRLSRMLALSALFGVSSVVGGIYSTIWLSKAQVGVAPGSAIVVMGTLQFLTVLMVAPRYGLVADWLRRRRSAPQQLIEDVLGCVHRAPGEQVPVAEVMTYVPARPHRIRHAIRVLERQGLLDAARGRLSLTADGHREALRLVRAHRLWEAYLEHVGTPAEQLHDAAHKLEHVYDKTAIDYLDDKLGHPLRDPHGSEIPEDVEHLVPGAEVKVSLLRQGHRATVRDVGAAALESRLSRGMQVTAGPRRAEGKTWTLLLDDGRTIELDHHAADAITVVLEQSPTP